MDAGALCLSSLGCGPSALRNPNASCGHQDRHKAPTLPRIRPLSLQQGRWGLDCRIWLLKFFIALDGGAKRDESRSYAFVLSLTYKYFIHPNP